MKRIFLVLLAVVAVLALLGVLLVSRLDTRFVADRIAGAVREATGQELVLVTPPALSLVPLGASFGEVRWGTAGKSTAVSVRGGKVSVALVPLFSGRVDISEIRLDGLAVTAADNSWRFACDTVRAALKGENGHYTLAPVTATLAGGGSVSGTLTIAVAEARYAFKGQADGVNVGALLEAFGKGRLAGGTANLEVDLTTRGSDSAAMLANCNGSGVLTLKPLRLQAMYKLPPIPVPGGKDLALPRQFDRVHVPFALRNGEIDAQPVTATAQGVSVAGQARANLVRQHLRGAATVRLAGLDIPLVFQGPFDKVAVSVDPKFALELTKKGAAALIGGSLEGGDAARQGAESAGDAAKKGLQEAGKLMRGLFGR